MKCFLYIIPIIIHITLLPFWFIEKCTENIALSELIIGMTVVPIYLIIVSYILIKNISIKKCIIYLILMIVIVIISDGMTYLNWGIYTGNVLQADSETTLIFQVQILVSVFIVVGGGSIAFLIKRNRIH